MSDWKKYSLRRAGSVTAALALAAATSAQVPTSQMVGERQGFRVAMLYSAIRPGNDVAPGGLPVALEIWAHKLGEWQPAPSSSRTQAQATPTPAKKRSSAYGGQAAAQSIVWPACRNTGGQTFEARWRPCMVGGAGFGIFPAQSAIDLAGLQRVCAVPLAEVRKMGGIGAPDGVLTFYPLSYSGRWPLAMYSYMQPAALSVLTKRSMAAMDQEFSDYLNSAVSDQKVRANFPAVLAYFSCELRYAAGKVHK